MRRFLRSSSRALLPPRRRPRASQGAPRRPRPHPVRRNASAEEGQENASLHRRRLDRGPPRRGAPPRALLPTGAGAVRTCLLAGRWRHLWKSAGLRIGGDGEINLGSVKERRRFIEHLLLLRDSAPLDTFLLRFHECEGIEDTARRNLWFRHALLLKVRFIQLGVCQDDVDFDPVPVDELLLVSRHLTRLQLHGTKLNDSFLNFSSCPALEHLVFDYCILECAKISSSSVKLLSITDSNFSETLGVRIDMPSLVSLRLDDLCDRTPVLERMPALVDAFVRVCDYTQDLCGESDSGDCGRDGCESCYGVEDINCVLLEGLSEAKTLQLINEHESKGFKILPNIYQVKDSVTK